LFFLLLIIPTYVAGTFLTYFFPLFAESQGLSTSDIGRWFIINGLFIIYFGPPLSRYFKQRVGQQRAVILGSVMWGLALLVFALTGSLAGAIATLILMGITEGFCVTAQNDIYLEFDVSKRLGQDRAVGYFEMFGKIGETAGPIIFSLALLLGEQFGIAVLGVVVIILALPFLLVMKRRPSPQEA
jgi:MFS family permease